MYHIDLKYTGEYGEIDPSTGNPEITISPIPDEPGAYNYSYYVHRSDVPETEINGTLVEEVCGINTLVFEVYPGSKSWECFFPRRTSLQLWSDREGGYIFSGRVASVEPHMEEDGHCYKIVRCESEIAYLCDSVCDLNEVRERIEEKGRRFYTDDIAITMLELHKLHIDGFAGNVNKVFYPPHCTWNEEKKEFVRIDTHLPYSGVSMENALNGDVGTTFALFKQLFVEGMGWDIWVEHAPDAVSPDEDANSQEGYLVFGAGLAGSAGTLETCDIVVGKNMKSLSIEYVPTNDGIITRIVPLGGVGANGRRLTVESIPQYHEGWTTPSYTREIANELLYITYGSADKVVIYDDLVDDGNKSPEEVEALVRELYRRGKAEADALSDGITSITVSAADLYAAGYDVGRLRIGNAYSVVADLFRLNAPFRLSKKVTRLADPTNPDLVFARTAATATAQTISRNVNTMNRIYNAEKTLSTRMDNTAIKLTTATDYGAMVTRNPKTIHLVDQGDDTFRAYIGDKPLVIEGGGGGRIEHAAIVTEDASELVVNKELTGLDVGQRSQAYYGGIRNKFYINNGLTVIYANSNDQLLEVVTEEDLATFNVRLADTNGVAKPYDVLLYQVTKAASGANEYCNYIAAVYTEDRKGWRQFTNLWTAATLPQGPRTIGLVFRATGIYAPTAQFPFGYIQGYLAAVSFDLNGNKYISTTLSSATGSGADFLNTRQVFGSMAEYDFAMSMITKSELVEDGG